MTYSLITPAQELLKDLKRKRVRLQETIRCRISGNSF